MRLILIRHGHVDGINPPRFRGRADLPLTKLGERQAVATAERLRASTHPVALYSSPQRRAVATASAIGAALDLDVQTVPGFADIDYGKWQGFSRDELPQYSAEIDLWFRAPQFASIEEGESLADVAARVGHVLGALNRRHPEDEIVLVGHDSVNRVALLSAIGAPISSYWSIRQDPCAINEIEFELTVPEARTVVRLVNDTWHLR
jgi:probable phosphoglycerate mutase